MNFTALAVSCVSRNNGFTGTYSRLSATPPAQYGIPKVDDPNRGDITGSCYFQVTQKHGWRWSAASAHPVGTAAMGQGSNAVVDHELRVRGVDRLRVADASIMPTITSGNTNAPCFMIGEKVAAMILEAAQRATPRSAIRRLVAAV